MNLISKIKIASLPVLLGLAATSTTLQASDLASRFTDNNNDLVADAPSDAKNWLDPEVLVFAYTPVEDPAVYAQVWDDFLKHMEKVTGKPVQFFPVQSNAAQLEAMRAGRLHVAGFNTGSNPVAVNCTGFVPFTMMARKDGSFGYEMEIITQPDSGITEIADIKGRNLAFTSPTSNSGFKAPSALLAAEFNLQADKDFTPSFSGSHDNSILGVVNNDYDAAAIANSVLKRMISREVVSSADYSTIYKSQTFPTTSYGYVYNLKPALAAKVKEAFSSYQWAGSKLEAEFKNSGEAQFIPITYKEHWNVVRKIDKALDVSYNCN